MISENKETNAPITLEEIVMVMINNGNRFEWNPIRSVIIRVESNSVCNHSSDWKKSDDREAVAWFVKHEYRN